MGYAILIGSHVTAAAAAYATQPIKSFDVTDKCQQCGGDTDHDAYNFTFKCGYCGSIGRAVFTLPRPESRPPAIIRSHSDDRRPPTETYRTSESYTSEPYKPSPPMAAFDPLGTGNFGGIDCNPFTLF